MVIVKHTFTFQLVAYTIETTLTRNHRLLVVIMQLIECRM